MKKAITCASRRTVFCIVALLAISACLGIMAVVLHKPQPAATGLSIRRRKRYLRPQRLRRQQKKIGSDYPGKAAP